MWGGRVWREDVYTRYLYTVQSAQHHSGVSMASIGRHPNWSTRPPFGQTGPSIAPENWYVGGTADTFKAGIMARIDRL